MKSQNLSLIEIMTCSVALRKEGNLAQTKIFLDSCNLMNSKNSLESLTPMTATKVQSGSQKVFIQTK
jgi:hypothetical protein